MSTERTGDDRRVDVDAEKRVFEAVRDAWEKDGSHLSVARAAIAALRSEPMVAMTPERTAALFNAADELEHSTRRGCLPDAATLRAMIAEGRERTVARNEPSESVRFEELLPKAGENALATPTLRHANVKVGDRVRYTDEGQIFERIVIPDGDEHGWAVASADANSEWGKRTYEVVQSAHYAPPGVPMVALTPERMAALEKAREALYHRIQFDIGPNDEIVAQYEAVEGILSEVRGDVGNAKLPGWSKRDDDFAERMAKRGWSIREIREGEQISGQVIDLTPAAAYIHAGRGSVVAVPVERLERVPQKDSLIRVALTSAGAQYDWIGAGQGLDRE